MMLRLLFRLGLGLLGAVAGCAKLGDISLENLLAGQGSATIVLWALFFVFSLVLLVGASERFTESAEKLGLRMGMSPLIIGITIVAIGTSLPEIGSSLASLFYEKSQIVIGNVVGSNLTNILLVLGLAAIIGKRIATEVTAVNKWLLTTSAILVAATAVCCVDVTAAPGVLDNRLLGSACVVALGLYYAYLAVQLRSDKQKVKILRLPAPARDTAAPLVSLPALLAAIIWYGLLIYLGAEFTVVTVVGLAGNLGIGEELIAVTAIALGTSLPELMVTISASRKGKADIAVGNVLGSNIFNSLAVLGIPAIVGPLAIPKSIMPSIVIMLMATAYYVFLLNRGTIRRGSGYVMVITYLIFIGVQAI